MMMSSGKGSLGTRSGLQTADYRSATTSTGTGHVEFEGKGSRPSPGGYGFVDWEDIHPDVDLSNARRLGTVSVAEPLRASVSDGLSRKRVAMLRSIYAKRIDESASRKQQLDAVREFHKRSHNSRLKDRLDRDNDVSFIGSSHGEPTEEDDMPRSKKNRKNTTFSVSGNIEGVASGAVSYSHMVENVVTAPVAYGTFRRSRQPEITHGDNEVTIKHSELVVDITAVSDAFVVSMDELVNPANPIVFSSMASLVPNWQKYRTNGLCFEYLSECKSETDGYFMMAPMYDPRGTPPTTKQTMSQLVGCLDTPVWRPLIISDDPRQNTALYFDTKKMKGTRFIQKFIEYGDVRTSDLGRIVLASGGTGTSGDLLGSVWVTYSFTLIGFVTSVPESVCTGYTQWYSTQNTTAVTSAVEVVLGSDLGSVLVNNHDGLNISRYYDGDGGFLMPAGSYWVTIRYVIRSDAATGTVITQNNGFYTGTKSVGLSYSAPQTQNINNCYEATGIIHSVGTELWRFTAVLTFSSGNVTIRGSGSPDNPLTSITFTGA